MTKKVKLTFAAALQLGLIASIGDFVGWPYMKVVLILCVIFFLLSLIFLIYDMSKD